MTWEGEIRHATISDIIAVLCLVTVIVTSYRMMGMERELMHRISERSDTVYVAVPDSLTFRLMDLGFICRLEEGYDRR